METKIVVFNSPPRGGKGVAASHMTKTINSQACFLPASHLEFKDELFKIAANTLGISVEEFLEGYDETIGEYSKRTDWDNRYCFQDYYDLCGGDYSKFESMWMKDIKMYKIGGLHLSKREVLIHMSENVIKPSFGKDAFGKALVSQLPYVGVVFISDSGFPEELQPVINHVGADNVLVVRIQRQGCTFKGDSRNYLEPDMFEQDVKFIQILNNGTEEGFKHQVEEEVGRWLNENL
jgi:hypothetical protein